VFKNKELAMQLNKFVSLLVISCVLLFSFPAYTQGYYYYSGEKINISPQPNRYVIGFHEEVPFQEKINFLEKNKLSYENWTVKSENIIIESTKLDEKQIYDLAFFAIVKSVTRLYTLLSGDIDFTMTDQLIVKFNPDISESQISKLIKENSLKCIEKKWLGERVYLYSTSTMDENLTLKIANQIYESGMAEFSHPDFLTFNTTETNDSYYSSQWNLTKISAADAWNITAGSTTILIAIVDNGVQSNHPDLSGKLVTGYNAPNPSQPPEPSLGTDTDYHGTACTGVAAAATNNGIGIAGIGYNCKILPIKRGHANNYSSSNNAAAINWAWNSGQASIINCSWNDTPNDAVTNAINTATSNGRNGKGCVVVKSSGNEGTITFPGTLPNVITVGMTNQFDVRIDDETGESGSGAQLDVMAPSKVCATDLTGSYGKVAGDYIVNNFTGTSAAAPHVSGLAGLILSVDNTLTEQRVRDIICYTAYDRGPVGWDQDYGWGRINAKNAVKCAAGQFTTSGTLQYNECWWGTINIAGNVTIPSGIRLTILDGTTINFSGSSFITVQSGGCIVASSPVIFNPADRSVRCSGTISQNNSWGFPVLLTDNVTINTGKVLTILPGSLI
jgi:hypothetical protein